MTLQGIKQRFGIIGNTPALDHALSTAMRVASTDLSVLITGESGVGKEVFSKIIHSLGSRKHNPFIAVNCGAIPKGTINSELFGHEKGAFTGADKDRKGYFETASSGTIFLDEIGEMPLDTQAYLLRILESGEFLRVGSSVIQKTDVRIVAATNVDLWTRIRNGKFREDLYYRLNTVPIQVPALRERNDDILKLFRKFVVDFADRYRIDTIRLTEDAQKVILRYPWPGNIRELKNLAEQLSILAKDRMISRNELLEIAPKLKEGAHLPSIIQNESESLQEREILYGLLFDMKGDLNELKKVVKGLISSNNLTIEDTEIFEESTRDAQYPIIQSVPTTTMRNEDPLRSSAKETAVTYDQEPRSGTYDEAQLVEESLSLEAMEKSFIIRALKKHDNRRRDAAKELGISERTLYRKIKQYEI